jgi:membrane-bound lytic murein transglycosylase B
MNKTNPAHQAILNAKFFGRCALAFAITTVCTLDGHAAQKKTPTPASVKQQKQDPSPLYADRQDAMAFADEMAARSDLDPTWVRRAIGGAHNVSRISSLMQPAAKPFVKNWSAYRGRFINPGRIRAGLIFWRDNQATLTQAEKKYGVPAELIVGVLGVETIYGGNTGSFRVIDALTTLAFDFPASHPRAEERGNYFKGELEQFLRSQSQRNVDPFKQLGSYAGAMGMPQFMPTSIRKYAVDFDGDGQIDLLNPADAIGSVANYFSAFGWKTGMPAYYSIRFDASILDMETLMAPDILPTFSVASFTAKGAVLEGQALQHQGPLALVELLNGAEPAEYVAGTENFYVITRYNWSSYYAMAVLELGREVSQKIKQVSEE